MGVLGFDTEILPSLRVVPAPVNGDSSSGRWPCRTCGEPFRVRAGYKLVQHAADGENLIGFVCDRCATTLNDYQD